MPANTSLESRLASMRMDKVRKGKQECDAALRAIEDLGKTAKSLGMGDLENLAETIACAIEQAKKQLGRELYDAKGAYNDATRQSR